MFVKCKVIIGFLLLLCFSILIGCSNKKDFSLLENKNSKELRILSLAPSITNMVCALGRQDNLVGVTRFCKYPNMDKKKIPTTGGYLDFNLEEALRLAPNLVILGKENTKVKEAFDNVSVEVCSVGIDTFGGITETISIMGNALGEKDRAKELVDTFNNECKSVSDRCREYNEHPKVLICLGRDYGTEQMGNIYLAGNVSIYEGALKVCNARNAVNDNLVDNPVISLEGVTTLNPDVIIDITPGESQLKVSDRQIVADWNVLPNVSAVKNKRVYVLSDQHASVPDQDFYKVVKRLSEIIYSKKQM